MSSKQLYKSLINFLPPFIASNIMVTNYFDPVYFPFSIVFASLPLILGIKTSAFISNLFITGFLITEKKAFIYCSFGISYSLIYAFASRICVGKLNSEISIFLLQVESLSIGAGIFLLRNKFLLKCIVFVLNISNYGGIALLPQIPIDYLNIGSTKFLPEVYKVLKVIFSEEPHNLKQEYKDIVEITHSHHNLNIARIFINWRNFYLPLLIPGIFNSLAFLLSSSFPSFRSDYANIIFFICLILNIKLLLFFVGFFCKWSYFSSWRKENMFMSVFIRLMMMWVIYGYFLKNGKYFYKW